MFLCMHQHHRALLWHDQFQSSSIYWHLVFYVQQTQPLKYMCILELSSTTIWPNQMTTKWYIHSYHMIIEWFKAMLHIMDVMGVARKNEPPANMICSSSLNGSDLEQIVQNRFGRLSLEWVEIWNESLWWNSVFVSYNDSSSRMYLQYHMKTSKRDQRAPKYGPLFYISD